MFTTNSKGSRAGPTGPVPSKMYVERNNGTLAFLDYGKPAISGIVYIWKEHIPFTKCVIVSHIIIIAYEPVKNDEGFLAVGFLAIMRSFHSA